MLVRFTKINIILLIINIFFNFEFFSQSNNNCIFFNSNFYNSTNIKHPSNNHLLLNSPYFITLNKKIDLNERQYKIDSIIVYTIDSSNFVKTKYKFFYNIHNKIDFILVSSLNGNDWIPNRRIKYEYGLCEKVKKIHYEITVNNRWENSILEIYNYDFDGNNISRLVKLWKNNHWTNFILIRNKFEKKFLVKSETLKWANEHWENYSYEINQFNNRKKQTLQNLKIWNDSLWLNQLKIKFKYKDELLSELLTLLWVKNNWINSYKASYIYPNTSELIILMERWVDNEWLSFGRTSYNFNNNGYVLYAKHECKNGDTWIPCNDVIKIQNPDNFIWYFFSSEIRIYYSSTTNINVINKNIEEFDLTQNYPNPFNPTTTIEYSIPNVGMLNATSSNVRLIVYDVLGRKVTTLVNEKQTPGNYSVKFDASNLPSGIYFYTLRAGDFVATKKMILMK